MTITTNSDVTVNIETAKRRGGRRAAPRPYSLQAYIEFIVGPAPAKDDEVAMSSARVLSQALPALD